MSRASGLFITATDTSVGKTVVTAALGCSLQRAGQKVGAFKPVQSGANRSEPTGDTMLLREWLALDEPADALNGYSFEAPLAPLVAARDADTSIQLQAILDQAAELAERSDTLLVEGAGGLLVPVGEIWTIADLARALDYPLIVVARAGLGTVNHTLLTVRSARANGLRVAAVVLNSLDAAGADADASYATNRSLIEEFEDVAVLGPLPWVDGPLDRDAIQTCLAPHLDAAQIERLARDAR